jgi:hypothetical protein
MRPSKRSMTTDVTAFFLIYLLACSITLVISKTTCYLQLVLTMIAPLLLFCCYYVVALLPDVLFLFMC